MHAAMDIRVIMAIILLNGFHDRQWLLRGGGIVEINQRMPMYLLVQNGKVLPDSMHIKRAGSMDMRSFGDGTHPTSSRFLSAPCRERSPMNFAAPGKEFTTSFSMWSRTCVECMRSRHSLAKASSSR